jgi:hypothetical protein
MERIGSEMERIGSDRTGLEWFLLTKESCDVAVSEGEVQDPRYVPVHYEQRAQGESA